ncbi:snare protein syntaxin 18/UFE1 [Boletus edulis]|nr:snare protein syntaxin 18/UFE1 [Boletus edulis]
MGHIDRTQDFRQVLQSKQGLTPPVKRRKLAAESEPRDTFGKRYVEEAYIILNHINALTRVLGNIRRPYLNVDSSSSPLVRQGSRNLDLNDSQQSWSEIKYLSNEERNQIDLQARLILTRCADRVREMEALEMRRVELAAQNMNPLARFLPARLVQGYSTTFPGYLAAHHASITWYLGRRLTEASQHQKELQEERVKRQLERTRTLGSNAAREVMSISLRNVATGRQQGTSDSWLGGASSALVSGIAATIGSASSRTAVKPPGSTPSVENSDDDDEELELTESQILQFETENANILRSVQDTLESVQQAEARLMDISNLQMELITHLTRQTELTEQLYEDAIATTSTVEMGNVQLREARRKAKDSRIFILVFLVGASLSLLFLHLY